MTKIKTSPKTLTTFINPFSYYIIRKSINQNRIYKNFTIHYDGIALALISRILFLEKINRVSFDDTSLAPSIFKFIAEKKLNLGIIGCSEENIIKAKKIIEEKYKITIKSFSDGYYPQSQTKTILNNFKKCDVVITAMGTPRQEDFLLKLREHGWNGVGYTCGGYLDQLSLANGGNYYPHIINKLEIRWLYRIYKEPRRLWKRYLIQYPIGVTLFIYDRIFLRPPFDKIKTS